MLEKMHLKGSNSGMARISLYCNEAIFSVRCCFFPGLMVHLNWQVLNSMKGYLDQELYMVLSQEQRGVSRAPLFSFTWVYPLHWLLANFVVNQNESNL